MKALQGKIAQAELDVGKRIVELNALTEPEKIYGAVKDWFNEFVDYMETTEPISPNVTMERVQENIRICLSRRLLRLPLSLLKDRRSEIESFHQRCERLRAAASAQFDSARTDADRMRWANQEGLAGSISRVLRQILDRIELNP
jgi:hypothetical protein